MNQTNSTIRRFAPWIAVMLAGLDSAASRRGEMSITMTKRSALTGEPLFANDTGWGHIGHTGGFTAGNGGSRRAAHEKRESGEVLQWECLECERVYLA